MQISQFKFANAFAFALAMPMQMVSDKSPKPGEPFRIYSIRLKTNLKLFGIKSDANQSSLIRIDYFLKGLISSIAVRVKSLLTETLNL